MRRRKAEVKTSLYDLISVLNDQPELDNAKIPEAVTYLARTGKIRWLKRQPPEGDVASVEHKQRPEREVRAGQGGW